MLCYAAAIAKAVHRDGQYARCTLLLLSTGVDQQCLSDLVIAQSITVRSSPHLDIRVRNKLLPYLRNGYRYGQSRCIQYSPDRRVPAHLEVLQQTGVRGD